MRIVFAAALAGLVLWPVSAGAVENFIPLGQGYAPGDSVLPPLNSAQDKFNGQLDIYETEIYTRQRWQQQESSYFRRFWNSQQGTAGSSNHLDY
jgi:hypothetical protein